MFKKFLILAFASAALLCVARPTLAQTSSLIFERAKIEIEAPLPSIDTKELTLLHPTLQYDIELRSEEALRLEYIHTLNTLTAESGVMIALDSPAIAALPRMSVYTPVDALLINEEGVVLQIVPRITLGEMNAPIGAQEPIKAILFLKAGEAAARGIRPKDRVLGRMFPLTPAIQN
jgi:uncharacterized membrane protein (UPF0127 family)